MSLISTEDRDYLVERYQQELENPVTIELFTLRDLNVAAEADENEAHENEAQLTTQQLFQELAAISPKIIVNRHAIDTSEGQAAAIAANINPEFTPAFCYKSAKLAGQSRYYGMPVGFEFGTLIETITDFSRGTTDLSETAKKKIAAIATPLEILVFVTPT